MGLLHLVPDSPRCPNTRSGCGATVRLADVDAHAGQCKFGTKTKKEIEEEEGSNQKAEIIDNRRVLYWVCFKKSKDRYGIKVGTYERGFSLSNCLPLLSKVFQNLCKK